MPCQVVMTFRIWELLYGGNNFRTNKYAAVSDAMLNHSSQNVYSMQWYQSNFPKIIKLTQLLANVGRINGRLLDVNSNSAIFDDQIEHGTHTFECLLGLHLFSIK